MKICALGLGGSEFFVGDYRTRFFPQSQLAVHAVTGFLFWQIAEKKDVFLIDASERLSGKEELFTDHVHLTEKGANELAKLASREIKEILKK